MGLGQRRVLKWKIRLNVKHFAPSVPLLDQMKGIVDVYKMMLLRCLSK